MRRNLMVIGLLTLTALTGFRHTSRHRASAKVADTRGATPKSSPQDATSFSRRAGVERLIQLEKRLLPEALDDGPWQYESLPDYYWAENQQLRARFNQIQKRFDHDSRPTLRALTLVAGTAGVGKTFIKHKVFDKTTQANAVCKFDLREMYEDWAEKGVARSKADLFHSDVILNNMLSVVDKTTPRVRKVMEQQETSFFIIDSLDEIHPSDYKWVLDQIADYVFSNRQQFVHVVVFARDVAFREFWQNHRDERDLALFLLNPPRFKTTGDLIVSSWNFHSWKYGLKWAPNGGELQQLPLSTYAKWAKHGFPRTGRYQSISCDVHENMRGDVHTTLLDWATRHRVVGSTLVNLAGNSLTRQIQQRETLDGRPYNERHFMNEYLTAWMVRDTKSSDRPSSEKPKHRDLYLKLMQQVAVRYLASGQIDDKGYFPVHRNDAINVEYQDKIRTFSVRQILDRSGLKITDLRKDSIPRYRFEPICIHRLLVEMHNEGAKTEDSTKVRTGH